MTCRSHDDYPNFSGGGSRVRDFVTDGLCSVCLKSGNIEASGHHHPSFTHLRHETLVCSCVV